MFDIKMESSEEMMRIAVRDPSIGIYHDKTHPGFYVARLFDSDKETNIIMVKNDLEELNRDIQEHTDMIFYPRISHRHPDLVDIWY